MMTMSCVPGIWRAVLADDPDLHLVECLLKSWCRLSKCVGGEYASLKCKAHGRECSLNVILLLEKYENTIELALAMLAGKDNVIRHWREEGEPVIILFLLEISFDQTSVEASNHQ